MATGIVNVDRPLDSGDQLAVNKATGAPIADKLSTSVNTQTISASETLDAQDCGFYTLVDTDAVVLTLPATVAGLTYTIVNAGENGVVGITIAPNAVDQIQGIGLTAADDKDLINTKATAKKGDVVTLVADGVLGWVVTKAIGTWDREA